MDARMDALRAKIDRLVKRYQHETTMPPAEALGLVEELRGRAEELLQGQSALWDAVTKLEHRIVILEQAKSTYTEPRG